MALLEIVTFVNSRDPRDSISPELHHASRSEIINIWGDPSSFASEKSEKKKWKGEIYNSNKWLLDSWFPPMKMVRTGAFNSPE